MSFCFFCFFFPTSGDLDTRKRTKTKERKEEKRISRTHQPRDGDDVRDALHALAQDVVREQERVRERGRVPDDAEEASVLKNIPRSFFCSRSVFRRSLFEVAFFDDGLELSGLPLAALSLSDRKNLIPIRKRTEETRKSEEESAIKDLILTGRWG